MRLLHSLVVISLITILVSPNVQSATDSNKAEDAFFEESMKPIPPPLTKIEKVLRTYAEAIGCDFYMNRKNIVEIDIDREEDKEKEFVALFTLDIGCLGGSGTGKSSIAVLKYRDIFHKEIIYVRPELSEPSVASYGFPKEIDKLFIKNRQLWYSGKIHKEGDANNLPTSSVQAQARLIKKEIAVSASLASPVYYWKSSEDYAK